MGKYYSKMHCSMTTIALSIFGVKPKIARTGVHSIVRESLVKWTRSICGNFDRINFYFIAKENFMFGP